MILGLEPNAKLENVLLHETMQSHDLSSNADDETVGGGDDSKNHRNEDNEVIARNEGRIVAVWRVVVLLVLVASAVVVSTALYKYGTSQEEKQFKDRFQSDANKVHEA